MASDLAHDIAAFFADLPDEDRLLPGRDRDHRYPDMRGAA